MRDRFGNKLRKGSKIELQPVIYGQNGLTKDNQTGDNAIFSWV